MLSFVPVANVNDANCDQLAHIWVLYYDWGGSRESLGVKSQGPRESLGVKHQRMDLGRVLGLNPRGGSRESLGVKPQGWI